MDKIEAKITKKVHNIFVKICYFLLKSKFQDKTIKKHIVNTIIIIISIFVNFSYFYFFTLYNSKAQINISTP